MSQQLVILTFEMIHIHVHFLKRDNTLSQYDKLGIEISCFFNNISRLVKSHYLSLCYSRIHCNGQNKKTWVKRILFFSDQIISTRYLKCHSWNYMFCACGRSDFGQLNIWHFEMLFTYECTYILAPCVIFMILVSLENVTNMPMWLHNYLKG